MDSKRNLELDMLKGIACLFVVVLHFEFPGETGIWLARLSSFAVPCFLLISGYYAYGKDEEVMKKRMIKAFLLLAFAFMLHAAFFGGKAFISGNLHQWLADNFRKKAIMRYALFCATNFSMPLCYLIAYFETCFFWYFIVRFKKENMVVKLLPVMFIALVTLSTTCTTLGLEWYYKVNFITFALVWFVAGYYIGGIPTERLERISRKKLFPTAAAGFVLTLIPTLFALKLKFSSAGEIPYAIAVFLLFITSNEDKVFMPLAKLGEKLSAWVYIFHPLVGNTLKIIVKRSNRQFYESDVFAWCKPIIVIAVSIILAWIFDRILRAIKKWMLIEEGNTNRNKVVSLVLGNVVFSGYIALVVWTRKIPEWNNPAILLGGVVIVIELLLKKVYLKEKISER